MTEINMEVYDMNKYFNKKQQQQQNLWGGARGLWHYFDDLGLKNFLCNWCCQFDEK